MDAGTHKSLFDAEGRKIQHWHESTAELRAYDVAGRMTQRHVIDGSPITAGQSTSRVPDGFDTDVNASDFAVRSATPSAPNIP